MSATATKTLATFPVMVEITEDQVRGLLCSAFEGGSNYWIDSIDYKFRSGVKYKDFCKGGEFQLDQYWHPVQLVPFHPGCAVLITVFDEEGDEERHRKQYRLDRNSIIKGLELFVKTHHFADLIAENDDATTGDVFLQLAVFGEVIYG